MSLVEYISCKDKALDDTIIDYLNNRSKSEITKQYVFFVRDISVAYIAIDWHQLSKGYACLYELIVVSQYRRKGHGNEILLKVESLVKNQGYQKLILWPRLIDKSNMQEEDLVKWYQKRGYKNSSMYEGLLEKQI